MPVELVEAATSAIFGLIDKALVKLEGAGKVPKYAKDALRIGGVIGGAGVNYFVARPGTVADKVSRAILLSALPLAESSVWEIIEGALAKGYRGGYVLESRPSVISVSSASTHHVSQPVGASAITSY
jgi:hypothetical protein